MHFLLSEAEQSIARASSVHSFECGEGRQLRGQQLWIQKRQRKGIGRAGTGCREALKGIELECECSEGCPLLFQLPTIKKCKVEWKPEEDKDGGGHQDPTQ